MHRRPALCFSTRGGAAEGTLRTPFPMEVAPRTTGGCPVRNFFAWIENSDWKKVLAMPMVTIRMLGWSGAKVACQKSACDTMSLKCQGTWRTGGRHVFSHSNTKEPPPATAAQFPSRALMCSRRMNDRTLTLIRRLDATSRKPRFRKLRGSVLLPMPASLECGASFRRAPQLSVRRSNGTLAQRRGDVARGTSDETKNF